MIRQRKPEHQQDKRDNNDDDALFVHSRSLVMVRYGVAAATTPGMAAAHALDCEERSAPCAVTLNGIERVFGTGGMKAAPKAHGCEDHVKDRRHDEAITT